LVNKVTQTGSVGRIAARTVGAIGLAAFFLLAFTPLAAALYGGGAPGAALPRADAIVVLGSGVMPEGDLEDNSLRRTVHGVRLFRQGLAPRLVLLGSEYHGAVEAEVRARYAADLGVPHGALIVESGGLSTRHEAQRVRAHLGARRPAIILVTGLHHMPRARRVFEREGMAVSASPVLEESMRPVRPQSRLALVRAMAQEAVARVYYRMAGAF
jgi:uncharacterized SAM-binding protein YcdF (DUF218 family)